MGFSQYPTVLYSSKFNFFFYYVKKNVGDLFARYFIETQAEQVFVTFWNSHVVVSPENRTLSLIPIYTARSKEMVMDI